MNIERSQKFPPFKNLWVQTETPQFPASVFLFFLPPSPILLLLLSFPDFTWLCTQESFSAVTLPPLIALGNIFLIYAGVGGKVGHLVLGEERSHPPPLVGVSSTVGRLAAQVGGGGGIAGLLCPSLLLPINSRSATSTTSDD